MTRPYTTRLAFAAIIVGAFVGVLIAIELAKSAGTLTYFIGGQ